MHYCAYSFADLFEAAHQRGWTQKEEQAFASLNQSERNQKVCELAELAQWQYENVVSFEGETFTAFWPKNSS